MLPSMPYFIVLYFAVLKAGGVVVCFNPLLAEREIEQQIADSRVEFMATLDLDALYGKLARVLERCLVRHLVVCRMSCILPMPQRQLFRDPASPGGGQHPDRRAPCLVRAADRQ